MPSLFDEAGLSELALAGLDQAASNALLDLGAATLPDDLRLRILEEAAGNPLALIELPAAASQLGTQMPQSVPLPLTARLEQTFASRLTTLDTDVQRLLLLAALDDVDLAELSRAAGAIEPRTWRLPSTRASGRSTRDDSVPAPVDRLGGQQAAT